MKSPKFSKKDQVIYIENGEQKEDQILNIFPVAVSKDGRPIIKRVDEIRYSYQLDKARSLRFNEEDLQLAKTIKSSK
ncbi:hypothetical protein [Chondrinema litorale]|uniref:hypothetical protein n=1 Tax=Chondrinema litorale TaxID=2994555 RepID=UPI002543AF32|nr:hypothetical protein [Chondrinema litorale]UZR93153.1 hypothetical protein OQ292_14935 [Chondrinema litorale]